MISIIEDLHSKECFTQDKLLVCDFKIWKVNDTMNKFVPMRKIWKLHENGIKSDFTTYTNKDRASSQIYFG